MEATGKFDFKASADDELSFRQGESLKVLQTTGNWYKAEINGVEGFVPKNFININLPSWYQENAKRSDSEEMLMSQPVGSFLVRGSKSAAAGNFSLSVRHPTVVQHYKVQRDKTGHYSVWSQKFSSLNQLVDHYKSNSVAKQSQVFLLEKQQQQRRNGDSFPPLPSPPISNPLPIPAPRQVLNNTHKSPSTLQVLALYSFHAEEADELDFDAGDIINVLECSDQSWWKGQLRGKTGLFPTNYTKPI
ncbi:GRB2-related adapter protein 2b isoform X2 [Channa argus]|uniref:GRB2-related adapter protein 2b isoform X2 n=1 Tax=Channa argus TaxID=215402 RepID=UPI00351FF2A9